MQTPDKTLTFVVTCRGRLDHLKESLPRLAAQPHASVVVVDYGCPQRTGDWVREHFPQVTVVDVADAPKFELARARNLGVKAVATPWICFTDADALVAPDFTEKVLPLLEPGTFLRTAEVADSSGQCACSREDFDAVGGYDAVLQGWGMEDKDLYARLRMLGLSGRTFPAGIVKVLPHVDTARVEHYENKSPRLNSTLNLVYCRAKWDLEKLGVDVSDEAVRARLYQNVVGTVEPLARAGKVARVQIPVGNIRSIAGAVVRMQLTYDLIPPGPGDKGYGFETAAG